MNSGKIQLDARMGRTGKAGKDDKNTGEKYNTDVLHRYAAAGYRMGDSHPSRADGD